MSNEPRTVDDLAGLARQIVLARDVQEAVVEDFLKRSQRPQPPFDHLRDFWTNFAAGPRLDGVGPLADDELTIPTRLFDFHLASPFGVPACALTPHAQFIQYFADRGFDLITYKTVRDRLWNPHPFPQWGFAPDLNSPLSLESLDDGELRQPIYTTLDPTYLTDLRNASLLNSFGVPSLLVEQWKADISSAKSVLHHGQVLIVSVMGSPDGADTDTEADLVRQFAFTAAHAVEAGADMIELNLSCPNTGRGGELICRDPELSARVAVAVRHEIQPSNIPLLIKTSYLPGTGIEELVDKCQKHIDGVVAINTLLASAVDPNGAEFFPKRPKAGLSGSAILNFGLDAVRRLNKQRAGADWVIIGVGGVTSPASYKAYIDEGADAVQSCSGAWLNPTLASEIRHEFGATSSTLEPAPEARSGRGSRKRSGRGSRKAASPRVVLAALLETLATGGSNVLRGE